MRRHKPTQQYIGEERVPPWWASGKCRKTGMAAFLSTEAGTRPQEAFDITSQALSP